MAQQRANFPCANSIKAIKRSTNDPTNIWSKFGSRPKRLMKTEEFLTGKLVSEELVAEAVMIAQTEIAPISDARGTETYKRLLLSQLIKAHFMKLFPSLKVK